MIWLKVDFPKQYTTTQLGLNEIEQNNTKETPQNKTLWFKTKQN